jgi:hypothetical protein
MFYARSLMVIGRKTTKAATSAGFNHINQLLQDFRQVRNIHTDDVTDYAIEQSQHNGGANGKTQTTRNP